MLTPTIAAECLKITEKPQVFFPSLSSLRFFAAVAVVIFHIEAKNLRCGLQHGQSHFMTMLGSEGVDLFFVLSSFLLTYLLLVEARTSSDINVKNFYVRRALRIWPLYLLTVVIAFFVVPVISPTLFHPIEAANIASAVDGYATALILYLCMLPNLALEILPRVICGSQCWSIGVEEQFYLFWPLLVKSLWKRPILMCAGFCAGLIISYFAINVSAKLVHGVTAETELVAFATKLVRDLRFMLIGAIAAVVFFLRSDLVARLFYNPVARFAIVVLIGLYLALPIVHAKIALGVLFGLLVLSLTDDKLKILKSPVLVYLGSISYGIYMFHLLVINLVIGQAVKVSPEFAVFAMYVAVLPLSIAVSAFSYKYYEKPFLRLKEKFSTVKSC